MNGEQYICGLNVKEKGWFFSNCRFNKNKLLIMKSTFKKQCYILLNL